MNIALYMRLSKEDEFVHEESNSISMQRLMLWDYAREHFPKDTIFEFTDDGYTGTNFDRPGIQELLDEVKNNEINCIIVKDFSRFARDYIELGSYLEQIFPFMGVRFISINDHYDSDQYIGKVADIDTHFRSLLYDLYSKDLSVKIKASLRSIKEQGKYTGSVAPFGYAKDPENRHQLVIVEDEAEIVRKVFRMYADGMSTVEIARVFNDQGIKPPSQVWMEKGIRVASPKGGLFVWQHSGIIRMLKNRVYVGDLVQGTRECREIRGKRILTDPEKWIITTNHHIPIIDRETFERVQARFRKTLNPWKRTDSHVLVGRVTCGCCGRNLRHNTYNRPYYWCSGLNIYSMEDCVKRIDDPYLEEQVLFQLQQHIRKLGESDRLLCQEKDLALASVEELERKCAETQSAIEKEKQNRMAEYEAYALGKRDSFDASSDYLNQLREKRETLLEELLLAKEKARKYCQIREPEEYTLTKLTTELLDKFIESIEVHPGNEVRISWK